MAGVGQHRVAPARPQSLQAAGSPCRGMGHLLGWELDALGRDAVAEIVAAFPRLGFKRELLRLLRQEAEAKPTTHLFHPCTMVAHHCLGGVPIPDARAMIDGAPFDEGED